jgi:ATP/maltotriose-dependent transcriptional regulator MalT
LSRAADWCEQDGQVSDAVGYALTAKDYRKAADLIARYWPQTTNDGEIETVRSWLDAMPEDAIRNSAPLGVAY